MSASSEFNLGLCLYILNKKILHKSVYKSVYNCILVYTFAYTFMYAFAYAWGIQNRPAPQWRLCGQTKPAAAAQSPARAANQLQVFAQEP